MSIYLQIIEVSFWAGLAAVGFGVLFNIPKKTILTVFLLGFLGGVTKFFLLNFEVNIILASLLASIIIGLLSIRLAHVIHYPPVVFAIPPMIPMIPGFYAYQALIAIMKYALLESTNHVEQLVLISKIFYNGFTMLFILIALILGISLPMLLLRKSSVKEGALPK